MAKLKAKKPTAKKSTSKPAKFAAKKPAPKRKPAVKAPSAPKRKAAASKPSLSADARRKLLRPRSDYAELVEQVAVQWDQNRVLRVPKLTASRLRKLARNAQTAVSKETALRAKLERQLQVISDARLLAEDNVWRAVLDVNAAVKLFARSDETLPERFGFLTDALTSARASVEPAAPVTPVTPTP